MILLLHPKGSDILNDSADAVEFCRRVYKLLIAGTHLFPILHPGTGCLKELSGMTRKSLLNLFSLGTTVRIKAEAALESVTLAETGSANAVQVA